MDFIFLQVVLQVCRELQRLSESQVLHGWFSFPVNSRTIRKMQTLEILPQLIPMLARPGIEGVLRHPADSRDGLQGYCNLEFLQDHLRVRGRLLGCLSQVLV